ncbi:hypothetical protein [uncultured Sneathia sp.]|uniref:hypothetical protein n=1 Tax=uncultured Sneathia sp. TaxID=278067 RepID=UPI00259ACCFB|nr:hypothetical protein [uncultured Sneathia sp.]
MTEKDRKEFVKLINEEFTRLEYEKRMKNNALTFEDIEDTISLLPKLKTMLKNNELQLEAVKLGLNQSNSGGVMERVQTSINLETPLEKQENIIEKLNLRITKQKILIERIENALSIVSNDEYYSIIEMKYWKKYTNKKISEELHISVDTLKRQKNRMIKEINIVFNKSF